MSVTIILPVYQAVDALAQCLAALERTLPAGVLVHLADDASPDPAISTLVNDTINRGVLTLRYVRREINLGFVGNVNAAFDECSGDDVILLNSDTMPALGWYEAMLRCAASDARIGTITPWSNNAEICSFPELCRLNPFPSVQESTRIAKTLQILASSTYPELPTGVGFCMFVRRAMLDRIGTFDHATFGRGYGEENDLCMRAAGHGWKNVLCEQAYVAHHGGASFALEGHHPGGENLRRLTARYPKYNALVADFIMRDPLAGLRADITAALAQSVSPVAVPAAIHS